MSEFGLKDSGERQAFASGMVRDTTEGKTNFLNVLFGPMLNRWAEHLTKGRKKYPDVAPGTPNWTLASGVEEYLRAKESAFRHFLQWMRGDRDEDHAAAVFFNINLAEYVLERMDEIHPGTGATVVEEQGEPVPAEDRPTIMAPAGAITEFVPGRDPGRVITYTPRVGGCPFFGCRVPGEHAGRHVL